MDGIAKKQTLKRIVLCIHNYLHNRNLKGVVIGLSFLKGCNFYIHSSNSRVIIGDDCVGACSLVNKKFEEEYTIIAGNPARVVKRQINWDTKNIPCTIKP